YSRRFTWCSWSVPFPRNARIADRTVHKGGSCDDLLNGLPTPFTRSSQPSSIALNDACCAPPGQSDHRGVRTSFAAGWATLFAGEPIISNVCTVLVARSREVDGHLPALVQNSGNDVCNSAICLAQTCG
ncbi:unnamed protein product, partial [Ectocarpus sp. 8 AP-2014]